MTARTSRLPSLVLLAAVVLAATLALLGAAVAPAASGRGWGPGQLHEWWSFDGSLHIDDRLLECTKAPDGSVYAVGATNENAPVTKDIFLVKFDSTGAHQWQLVYHVPGSVTAGASAITTDANNNVIVTGSLWDGADYDMFTAKWNAAGTLVWYAIQASAAGGWDGGNDLVTDSAGNVYAAGMMDGWTEGIVVKYAAAEDPGNPGHGDEQWVHHFLGTAAYEQASCEAIAIDSSGRIYVTGYRATATGGADIFVSRLQADGGGVWLRGYNSYRKRGDYATSIATGNGGIWVAGNADKPHNATDVALLHYSASGHRVWVRTWDDSLHKGENVAGLGIDRYGNAYLAAEVWPTSSAYKVALIKYAHSGTRRWTKLYRGVTGDTGGLQCSDMAVSPGGSAWLVGSLFTAGDAFWKVVKYNRAGKRLWTTTWPTGQPGGPTSGQPWACVLSGTSDLFVAGDGVMTIGGRNAVAAWFVR